VPRTRFIAQAGVIAAVYAVLTWLTLAFGGVLAWGPVQFRVSEAAVVLAVLTPAAIPGLTIGSVIANAFNPGAVWPFSALDVVLGSLGTCLGAIWSWRFRRRTILALLGPVIANSVIVAAYLPILMRGIGVPISPIFGVSLSKMSLAGYGALVTTIAVGEAAVVFMLGYPLLAALRRTAVVASEDL
jgi:uncharacterized membrane protein